MVRLFELIIGGTVGLVGAGIAYEIFGKKPTFDQSQQPTPSPSGAGGGIYNPSTPTGIANLTGQAGFANWIDRTIASQNPNGVSGRPPASQNPFAQAIGNTGTAAGENLSTNAPANPSSPDYLRGGRI